MQDVLKTVKVSGDKVLEELQRLHKERQATGLYPFIIGTDEEVAILRRNIKQEDERVVKMLIYITNNPQDVKDTKKYLKERRSKEKVIFPKNGIPPAESPNSLYDLSTKELKPEINIGLVQAKASWEVFLKLGYGDWNDCPPSGTHARMGKYWFTKHQAILLCLSHDVVEYYVPKPPVRKATALELAYEQHVYCYDIVEQGVGTLGNLASSLLNGHYWYFWWD